MLLIHVQENNPGWRILHEYAFITIIIPLVTIVIVKHIVQLHRQITRIEILRGKMFYHYSSQLNVLDMTITAIAKVLVKCGCSPTCWQTVENKIA